MPRAVIPFLVGILLLCVSRNEPALADKKGTSFNSQPQKETTQEYADWLSRVPHKTPLSQVSMPGTHDTCALHNGFSFGFAKCQSWKLPDQLKAGIRFLDIRCRHIGNDFKIYHGIIDQRKTFAEVRDDCREFLRQHPSECIVMSIKSESTPKNNSRSFAATFKELTKADAKLWHFGTKCPQLGEVRGQIVVVDRVGSLNGIPWRTLAVQDEYTAPLERKAKAVRQHLMQAGKVDDQRWFLNLCSGTRPVSLTPRKYALQSNEVVVSFLEENDTRPLRLGTIIMDFPGEELVEQIIESNFSTNTD